MIETMPAELAENLIDFCENRSRVYALLSRCYETEIDAAFAEALAGEAALASDDAGLAAGFAALQADLARLRRDALEQLAVVFDRAFFGMGPRTAQKASRTSRCTRARSTCSCRMRATSAVAFYLGEELGLPADNTTPEDHLSFEFQFMAKLIERAGAALDAGDEARYAELCAKQRAFFDEHLANWVPRLCADVRAYAQTAFYRGVADITEGFLQLEDQRSARAPRRRKPWPRTRDGVRRVLRRSRPYSPRSAGR